MDLALSDGCPLFDEQHQIELMTVLRGVVLGWHNLATPASSLLAQTLPDATWRTYGLVLTESSKLSANAPHLYRPTNCDSCDPGALANLLGQPTVVIVENPGTDGRFLHTASSLLRPRLFKRLTAPHPSVVVAHGAGIGEVPKEIKRHVRELRAASYVPGLPRRVVAITDSDARSPGRIDAAAKAVADTASEDGIDYHILAMRSIENYIPDEALSNYTSIRTHALSALSVVAQLSQAARDHYPMKIGLPVEGARSPEEISLYGNGIPPNEGFGDFIVDLLENFAHLLTRIELKARDHDRDLEKMLDAIERNV